eukprot:6491249-Amphidinium_carterae.5
MTSSTGASTVPRDSPPTKMSKGVRKLLDENMKAISDKLKNNLEWQRLTLQNIMEWEDDSSGGAKIKKSKSNEDLSLEPAGVCQLVLKDGETLGRSGRRYCNWSKGMLLEVLHYLEPALFPLTAKRVDSVEEAKRLLCFACEVNTCKAKSDAAAAIEKKTVFDALRDVYVVRLCPLRHLLWRDTIVNWCSYGEFSLSTVGDLVTVKERSSGKVATVPADIVKTLKGGVWRNGVLRSNHSYDNCHVENAFPMSCRRQARRSRRRVQRPADDASAEPAVSSLGGSSSVVPNFDIPEPPDDVVDSAMLAAGIAAGMHAEHEPDPDGEESEHGLDE